MHFDEKRVKIQNQAPELWAEVVREVKAIVSQPAFEFGSTIVPGFQVGPASGQSGPTIGCEFRHRSACIAVHGFKGYDPPETCYLFRADDDGNVFLAAEKSANRLNPQEAARAILGPFLEKYK